MTLLMERMLPIMYWGDDEENRKKRLEEKLSEKKARRMVEHGIQPSLPDKTFVGNDETKEEIAKQNTLIEEQRGDIRSLQHLLIQQGKVLQQILEKQGEIRYEIINKSSAEEIRKKDKDADLPTLRELDIKMIHTDGIEAQGQVGEEKKEGQSIQERAAKLRALRQRGKKE